MSALSSLTICSLNTDAGCGFQEERKSDAYNRAWRRGTAPPWCRRYDDTPHGDPTTLGETEPIIYADRIGVCTRELCDARRRLPQHRPQKLTPGGCMWSR